LMDVARQAPPGQRYRWMLAAPHTNLTLGTSADGSRAGVSGECPHLTCAPVTGTVPPMSIFSRLENMTAGEAMRRKVVSVTADQTLGEAAKTMRDEGVTALAVVGEAPQRPGIITERDIGRAGAHEADPRKQIVRDFLTVAGITATTDWGLERAVSTMMEGNFRHLLIVEEGEVTGILSMRDVVRATAQEEVPSAPEIPETGEMPAVGAAERYLYTLRRNAKQHLVAAKCTCQWEWYEVVEGQLQDRPDLGEEMLRRLWDSREPCPVLHAEGGGAD